MVMQGDDAAPEAGGPGAPAAGPKQNLQLPPEVVQRLRSVIFGFDFFVTKAENYQARGVLFRGSLRGDPAVAYDRIAARLKVLKPFPFVPSSQYLHLNRHSRYC